MQQDHPLFTRIKEADQAVSESQQNLKDAVAQARTAGATWQQIGSALGISKQAAAQRFNDSPEVYNARDMGQIQKELLQIAEEFFTAISHDDLAHAKQLMSYTTARLLSQRKIRGVWQQVIDATGNHIELLRTTIEQSGSSYVLTYRLRHEQGEPVGQISFNIRKQITGWVIFLDDSAELPW